MITNDIAEWLYNGYYTAQKVLPSLMQLDPFDIGDAIWRGTIPDDNIRKRLEYEFRDVNLFGYSPFKNIQERQRLRDYMKNTGLTWADVKYPALQGGSGLSGVPMYVSRNIDRLYGEDRYHKGFSRGLQFGRRTGKLW